MHIYLLKVRYTISYMHGAVGSADSLKNLAGGLGPHRWKISGKQMMRARGQKSVRFLHFINVLTDHNRTLTRYILILMVF